MQGRELARCEADPSLHPLFSNAHQIASGSAVPSTFRTRHSKRPRALAGWRFVAGVGSIRRVASRVAADLNLGVFVHDQFAYIWGPRSVPSIH